MKKLITILIIAVLLLVFAGCNPTHENIYEFGTLIELTLEKGKVNRSIKEIKSSFSALNNIFETEITGSDLYKINHAESGEEISVSNETYELLQLSKELYTKTDGAFNIATYPLTILWKFSPDTYSPYSNDFIPPTQAQIDDTLKYCNFDDVILKDNNIVVKNNSNIQISFGALAKGYAGDKAYDIVTKNKNSGIINVGGTIFICGEKDSFIGIGNPRDSEFDFFGKINLKDGAIICTSGDYYRYYTYEGSRYHHIIGVDGYPSNNGIISVTIVSTNNKASGALCDALSTSVVSLGTEKGVELINSYGLSAIIIMENKTYTLINLDESIFTLKDTNYTKNV